MLIKQFFENKSKNSFQKMELDRAKPENIYGLYSSIVQWFKESLLFSLSIMKRL